MKTFLKIFSISTLLMNTIILTVACRPDTLGEIWIITDGGDLFDKAFNEQVYIGANDFVTKFNLHRDEISSNNKGFEVWKNHEMRLKWIIAKDTDISTLHSYYQMAGYAGAKTVITIGFGHVKALADVFLQTMYKSLGIKFILIDAPLTNYINTASLIYASEQSSFLAGLAGAIWLVANNPDKPELKMSTFGGQALDTVVTIMLGYYWGVQYYNLFKDQTLIKNMLKAINSNINLNKLPEITFDSIGENQFTDGFQSGTNQARTITEILVNQHKNDIVFPVAGGQVSDLINAITNYNQKAKLIGVDVDQAKQYPEANDYFLTSSLKGLKPSTEWMLWNSFDLNQNTFKYEPTNEGYFNGQINANPLKEHEFLGITKSKAIENIFDTLNDSWFWDQANRVSNVIANLNHEYEVQNHPANFWRNAWKNHEENWPNFDESNLTKWGI